MGQRSIIPYWNNAYKFKFARFTTCLRREGDHSSVFLMWFDCIFKCVSEQTRGSLSWQDYPICATCALRGRAAESENGLWAAPGPALHEQRGTELCWALLSAWHHHKLYPQTESSFDANHCWLPDPKVKVLILMDLTDVCCTVSSILFCCCSLSTWNPSSAFMSVLRPESRGLTSLCSLQTAVPGSN